ncbi:MAG: hypothetical protein AAB198_07385 [Actinomycetota bacterium]
MPAAPLIVALLIVVTSGVGWVTLALAPEPFAVSAAVLFSGGLAILTIVAVSGTLLARGRWARHLGTTVALAWIGVGAAVDTLWGNAVIAVGAGALAANLGPWLGRWLRRLPSTDGTPPAAVVALLALLLTPPAVAIAGPGGVAPASWAFAAWSVLLALALGRTVPGALTAARLAYPAAAIFASIAVGFPTAIPILVSGAVVAVLCWRRDLAVAIAPILPRSGEALRIPPELAPPEVLEAAGADDTGRRIAR